MEAKVEGYCYLGCPHLFPRRGLNKRRDQPRQLSEEEELSSGGGKTERGSSGYLVITDPD